jgi:transposase-like protein
MPFTYPAYKEEMQDGRRKLSKEDKAEVVRIYKEGVLSQRDLARLYNVSRRLIVFTLYPEREALQKERVKKEKRWIKYYNTDQQREYMRKHRAKKKEIFPNHSCASLHYCHDCKALIEKRVPAKYCVTCGKIRRKETYKKCREKKKLMKQL